MCVKAKIEEFENKEGQNRDVECKEDANRDAKPDEADKQMGK